MPFHTLGPPPSKPARRASGSIRDASSHSSHQNAPPRMEEPDETSSSSHFGEIEIAQSAEVDPSSNGTCGFASILHRSLMSEEKTDDSDLEEITRMHRPTVVDDFYASQSDLDDDYLETTSDDEEEQDEECDGEDGEDGEEKHPQLKKTRSVRLRRKKKKSVLFRNDERPDHLQELYLRNRIQHRLVRSLQIPRPAGIERQVTNDTIMSATTAENLDDSHYLEVKAEVAKDIKTERISEHVREVRDLWKSYTNSLNLRSAQYPLEVRMENVTYVVPVNPDGSKIRTVYNSSFVYSIYKFFQRRWRGLPTQKKPKRYKKILNNISLVLKPGKMYLVLGPPGSGKTSLLRAIAGLLRPSRGESLGGKILYNGKQLEDSRDLHIENAFGYIDQLDKHAPRLTVEETFEFAYQCRASGMLNRNPEKEERAALKKINEERLVTKVVLKSLGLWEVKDTYVGDTSVRGVSGGQRRRVTVGEMLMSRSPVLSGDEISTGLDAASTYDMVEAILHFGRVRKMTRIFSLLQPSPETVSLFDYVIVMAEGHIIYLGPIEKVEKYFAKIGFKSPEFMDVADFLQMVSGGDGAELYDPPEATRRQLPNAPTVRELASMFKRSELGRQLRQELHSPLAYVWEKGQKSRHGGHDTSEVTGLAVAEGLRRKFSNNFFKSTHLILQRFLTLWIRDRRVIIAGAVKNVLMGVSCGGVFSNTTDIQSLQGALFQAGLFIMLGSMQNASGLIFDRVIFYKHADANFYSAWPFVFGRTIAGLPQTTMDTLTFGTLMYYIVGFAGRAEFGNYTTYISILLAFALLMNQQMALFATIASGSSVQVYSACTILLMMLFCGFIVAPDVIPSYFWWVYWWNPLAWAYRALILNEFRSDRWGDNSDLILDRLGFEIPGGGPFGHEWVAYGFYYMGFYFLLCTVLMAVGLTFVRAGGSDADPEQTVTPPRGDVEQGSAEVVSPIEIPFQRVTLSFHDVCYEVTASTTSEKLKLLKNVNGVFHAGRMCALMGSSGAGKTTLLDVIALRKRTGTITGEVRLNGWKQDPISFRRCSGYVEQFDVQSPELTVRETILFSARLRLDPRRVPTDDDTLDFVDYIMAQVELSDLASALVGTDETGGLSFEQKKRLSIAAELAASPSVIFLDEPTSGLDARSALLVVKTLRRIADTGRAICATIHQPSSAVFDMFDDLLLLKKGGEVVYHGELGENCQTLVSYFESRGAKKIHLGENPANWMLRVITSDEMEDSARLYEESKEYGLLMKELTAIMASPPEDSKITFDTEFAASFHRRQELVNRRLRKIYWRSPTYNLARVLVSIGIAIILGSIFLTKHRKDTFREVDIHARLSVIFLTFIIIGIMAIISVLPVMTRIRDMYYRHRDAGMYSSPAMGLALGVAEKWFIVLSSALFCIVFLSVSDMSNSIGEYVTFWGFFTFNFAIYSYIGQCFVCLVKPLETALILSSVFIGLNNFFSGLIVRPQFLVGTFFVMPYTITPGRYVYEGMVMAIYSEDNRTVFADQGSEFYNYLNCTEIEAESCEGTITQYIDNFYGGEFSRDNIPRNGIVLGFVLTLVRVLTWLALKYIRFS